MKTYIKKHGIVLTTVMVLLLVGILMAFVLTPKALAATSTARTISFPYNAAYASAYTTTYLILVDEAGNLVNDSTGTCSASVTWAQATNTITAHAQSNENTATVPALDKSKQYRLLLCADTANPGTPTKTDTRLASMHYDPDYGTLYGEFAPSKLGIIPVKDMPVHLP